uniref:Uncharacterized protein n=1 Tax=Nothoprocta perdicaria TaxID=30464 RepID=A0A8C6YL40_NOTPE
MGRGVAAGQVATCRRTAERPGLALSEEAPRSPGAEGAGEGALPVPVLVPVGRRAPGGECLGSPVAAVNAPSGRLGGPKGARRPLRISHSGRFKERRKVRTSLLADGPEAYAFAFR